MGKSIERGRTLQAQNDMRSFNGAIGLYYQTYGRLPSPETAGDYTFEAGQNPDVADLVRALQGDSATAIPNPREVSFFDLGDADGELLDPWGAEYVVMTDADYSGAIEEYEDFDDGLRVSSVVISLGPDGVLGTEDDILAE